MKLKNKKPKIGIAGVGYVGGAVRHWFKERNFPLFLYDKYKEIGSIDELNKAEIIFLCLPTPYIEKENTETNKIVEKWLNIAYDCCFLNEFNHTNNKNYPYFYVGDIYKKYK